MIRSRPYRIGWRFDAAAEALEGFVRCGMAVNRGKVGWQMGGIFDEEMHVAQRGRNMGKDFRRGALEPPTRHL